ncbi:MAG TPA: GH1 family beta-glucosidase [Pseudonocardiaceae bacterium]|jgi:beta-glucosidase|nr:GH1 family beta-glucosidase [Pseudonocardiaceae bacterium]
MDTAPTTVDGKLLSGERTSLIGRLPSSFRWGVATSAYQIEGAVHEDGRTASIWDTFCRVPGAVDNGDHGDIACDHYHRMPEDVALIHDLGVDAYRFSVAWPRIQPGGRGPANPAGLAFYDRLVDELLGKGIEPWLTLYHWDLPQELEDAGGWPVRDTAYRFADFAMLVFDHLRDRVSNWTTLNEPWCSAMHGYVYGLQAPGRTDFTAGMHALHHLLLGHGLAAQRIRAAAGSDVTLAITLNTGYAEAASDSPADQDAARWADGLGTRMYLDPLVHGHYPADMVADLGARGIELPVREGDLELISTPLDLLGVNYYFGQRVRGTNEHGDTRDEQGLPVAIEQPFGRPTTAMGWEILPDVLADMLVRISRDYPGLPMVVTENGAAFEDRPDENGFVRDDDRIRYLAVHLDAVADAVRRGADMRGYFAWSALDNFEWAYGYHKRFGLIRVDYETQARTPKQSAHWYRDIIRQVRAAES